MLRNRQLLPLPTTLNWPGQYIMCACVWTWVCMRGCVYVAGAKHLSFSQREGKLLFSAAVASRWLQKEERGC